MEQQKYITKKRVSIYMPVELDKKLKKLAQKSSTEKGAKISQNQMSLSILENYFKESISI